MNTNKIYREIDVHERLPTKEGRYLVKSHGEWFSASYLKDFSFHEEFMDCGGVTHWMEPIQFPSKEEIEHELNTYVKPEESFEWGFNASAAFFTRQILHKENIKTSFDRDKIIKTLMQYVETGGFVTKEKHCFGEVKYFLSQLQISQVSNEDVIISIIDILLKKSDQMINTFRQHVELMSTPRPMIIVDGKLEEVEDLIKNLKSKP